jgi:hypothetical protein
MEKLWATAICRCASIRTSAPYGTPRICLGSFTSESKEAIAHYPEIEKEVKLALQECGRHLSTFIKRKRKAADEFKKKSYIKNTYHT